MRKKKSMAEGERGRGGEVTQTLETEEDYLDKIFFNFLKEQCNNKSTGIKFYLIVTVTVLLIVSIVNLNFSERKNIQIFMYKINNIGSEPEWSRNNIRNTGESNI